MVVRPPSCKPSLICDIPLMRGDCGYPSSEWLIVEVVLVSLLVKRWIVFEWLWAYPFKCRGDLFCSLPLSVEVVLVERGVVYSQLYFPQILSGGSLCGRVSENPSV